MKEKDFTPTGLRMEGGYENDRNADEVEKSVAAARDAARRRRSLRRR